MTNRSHFALVVVGSALALGFGCTNLLEYDDVSFAGNTGTAGSAVDGGTGGSGASGGAGTGGNVAGGGGSGADGGMGGSSAMGGIGGSGTGGDGGSGGTNTGGTGPAGSGGTGPAGSGGTGPAGSGGTGTGGTSAGGTGGGTGGSTGVTCSITDPSGTGNEPNGEIPVCCAPSAAEKILIDEVFTLLNQHRASNGVSALNYDDQLEAAMQGHCIHMDTHPFWSHTAPESVVASPWARATLCGTNAQAENIARGQNTAQDVMNSWMSSSGHNDNMLSSSYTRVGIGHHQDYWGQLFGP